MSPSIRRLAEIMASAVVETVYPKVCAGCGMRGTWLCIYCEHTVPSAIQPVSCPRCGVPKLGRRCGCADLDHAIAVARSAYVYDGWVATAVKGVKYHGESARAGHLASLMMPALSGFGPLDGIIPVPLHGSRERERGYNQAALLSEGLASNSGVPVLNVMRRVRKTVSQTTLSGHDRMENVAGSFSINPTWVPPTGGRYLLVDDVRTTGATLNACADALRPVQPATVGILTFALDVHREQVEELRAYEANARASGGVAPPPLVGSPSGPMHLPQGRHRGP
jgi:ComF family protein